MVFVAVAGLTWLVAQGLADSGAADGALVGMTAPETIVETFDGGTWRLSESMGDGPVVVNLWASYCPPCIEEIPELSRFSTDHPRVTVVGVAVRDDPDDARRMAADLQPTYVIGLDATGRLRDALPTVGLPSTFVIDQSGIIVAQFERPVTAEDLEAALP